MLINGFHLICDEKQIIAGKPINGAYNYFGFSNFSCKGAEIGVQISNTDQELNYRGVKIAGDEGAILDGCGITLGKKAKVMHIQGLQVWSKNT